MESNHEIEDNTLSGTSGDDVMETSHDVQRISGLQGDDTLYVTGAGGAAWGGGG